MSAVADSSERLAPSGDALGVAHDWTVVVVASELARDRFLEGGRARDLGSWAQLLARLARAQVEEGVLLEKELGSDHAGYQRQLIQYGHVHQHLFAAAHGELADSAAPLGRAIDRARASLSGPDGCAAILRELEPRLTALPGER